jgi:hypothetical protein
MSKRKSSRKSRRRRERRVDPLVWLAAIPVTIVAFLVFNAVQSGAFAKAPEPSRSEDPADLLPLAQAGQSLSGGHDMSLIPEQTPAPREVTAGITVPRLDMPSASHDFGQIYDAWDVTHTFAVQNTGDADLLISNLATSCGCTTAYLSSNVIPPGQRADLTVTFDANFHPTNGPVSRLVWFATNDPTQPWVEVRVIAVVR